MTKYKTIAIDFDGTIIEEGIYPDFGEPKPNAIHTMKRLIDNGVKIIIWTCRGGEAQKEGIKNMLNKHGLYEFVINEHLPEVNEPFEFTSPKVYCDLYIDDRNLFTEKIDWYEIENILFDKDKK